MTGTQSCPSCTASRMLWSASVQSNVSVTIVVSPSGWSSNDTPIVISDCNGSAEQVWIVEPGGTLQANGKCMDIYRDEKTSKAPVELWTCNGGLNQQWQLP